MCYKRFLRLGDFGRSERLCLDQCFLKLKGQNVSQISDYMYLTHKNSKNGIRIYQAYKRNLVSLEILSQRKHQMRCALRALNEAALRATAPSRPPSARHQYLGIHRDVIVSKCE